MESAQSSGKGEAWLDEETESNKLQVGREISWVKLGWQLALASTLVPLVRSRYKSSGWGNFSQQGQEGLSSISFTLFWSKYPLEQGQNRQKSKQTKHDFFFRKIVLSLDGNN